MTRSFAKDAAEGALIDSPGGGPFRRDGSRSAAALNMGVSAGCPWSLPSCDEDGLLPPFCRASIS